MEYDKSKYYKENSFNLPQYVDRILKKHNFAKLV